MTLDTSNEFGVAIDGDGLCVAHHWKLTARRGNLTMDEALVLAAWLLALADPDSAAKIAGNFDLLRDTKFGKILNAIVNG